MKELIKKLVFQNKYARYKELFSIDMDDIIAFGGEKFISLLKTIHSEDTEYKTKYFRLDDIFHEDSFTHNKGKLLITIHSSKNKDEIIKVIRLFSLYKINFKILLILELSDEYIDDALFSHLLSQNTTSIYIKSRYTSSSLNYIKKNISIWKDKEVYIGLDYFSKQEEVNHQVLFEIMHTIQRSGGIINNDLIRLESAYRGLYVLGPKELHLDLYEYCNAHCNFCFTNGPGFLDERDDKDNHYKLNFSGEKFVNLFRKIQNSGTENLALGITGEPFLHPEIGYILKELENIPIKVGFLTNGYKMLENMSSIINNTHITHFYINISCGNKESFTSTRIGDNFINFQNTWKAIKAVRDKRPDIIVRGLYVITPLNICGLQDFIDLCIQNNISEIEFKRVVPYEFSNKEFYFSDKDIQTIIKIISDAKEKLRNINHNSDYIINEYNEVLKGVITQYPEDKENDFSKITGKTMHCYNPYFYIALMRSSSYTCGKFIAKIGNLSNLDLYELLFEKQELGNIFKASNNIQGFLGVQKWKEKCSRCHHLDVINMVAEYIHLKKISLNLKNDSIPQSGNNRYM